MTIYFSLTPLALTVAATQAHSQPAHADSDATGARSTEILKWKDGKRAVFYLAFDDSCETHLKNAIPEMRKRGLTGVFYINPGNGPFKNKETIWRTKAEEMGVEYGNHTYTHAGATSAEQLDKELAQCNEVIHACFPNRNRKRLISFGRPGGVPWTVTKEETAVLLAQVQDRA